MGVTWLLHLGPIAVSLNVFLATLKLTSMFSPSVGGSPNLKPFRLIHFFSLAILAAESTFADKGRS